MKTALFNRFEIELPSECVRDCSHSGSCDEDVQLWLKEIQINIDPETLRSELREYGAWSAEELSDHHANLGRILWIAAGNIREEEKEVELCRF